MVEIFERMKPITATGADILLSGIGATGGLLGGKFIGDMIEKASYPMYAPGGITEASAPLDKFLAWFVNNAPKGLIALGLASMVTPRTEAIEYLNKVMNGLTIGVGADILVDSIGRLTAAGVPTKVLGESHTRLQKVLRENAELRAALQRISTGSPMVRVETAQIPPREEIIPRRGVLGTL